MVRRVSLIVTVVMFVRYNLLSTETAKLPRGSDVVGIFQAGVMMLFHSLQAQDAHIDWKFITEEAFDVHFRYTKQCLVQFIELF